MSDDLGDRMKRYEAAETGRLFMPGLPIYARIDGRCFSNFTRGMKRPYDDAMISCMVETTSYLVDETHANIGYTQSDEISLAWAQADHRSDLPFGGKVFKLASVLASMAAAKFAQSVRFWIPDWSDKLPAFDCRVFQLPSLVEASNCILWREQDAAKNAIQMATRAVCSHKECDGKNTAEMNEMLFQRGINFNDYPPRFKRGTFVQRKTRERELSAEELQRIPEKHRPTGPVLRSRVEQLDMPIFSTVTNRVAVIFEGAAPQVGA